MVYERSTMAIAAYPWLTFFKLLLFKLVLWKYKPSQMGQRPELLGLIGFVE